MSVPVTDCSYCRCTLTDEETVWCSGLCQECLIDRLRDDPLTGIPLTLGAPDEYWNGKHWYAFLCPRCDGSGHVYASTRTPDTYCFGCGGDGWIVRNREGVQRTARWWQTYQQNRVPETRP
jgi:hypothetical protein